MPDRSHSLDLPTDPRWYQIACLAMLLAYGMLALDFDITAPRVALIVATAQITQYGCTRWAGLPRFDPVSAFISSLSMCLLLRTNHAAIAGLATVIAIASKFAVRVNDKHVFNPTNLGIAATILLTDDAWVSPGQWGSRATLAFLFACIGGFVVFRSQRSDITAAFALLWGGLVIGRSWWIGEPMTIPLHRLESGAFLLFAFFMISDPKTTPNARSMRVLYAGIVAFAAWYWQFRLFHTNGLLWALVALSPLVPVLDRLVPAARFAWPAPREAPAGPRVEPATAK